MIVERRLALRPASQEPKRPVFSSGVGHSIVAPPFPRRFWDNCGLVRGGAWHVADRWSRVPFL